MNVQHLQNNPYNTSTGYGYTWPQAPSNLSLSGSGSPTISANNPHFPSQIQLRNSPVARTTCSRYPINNQNFGNVPMYQNTHGVRSCNCNGPHCPPQPVNYYPFFNPYQYQQWNCSSPPQPCGYSVQKPSSHNETAVNPAEPKVSPYIFPILGKKPHVKVGHSQREKPNAANPGSKTSTTSTSTGSNDYTYKTTETYKYTNGTPSSKSHHTGQDTTTKSEGTHSGDASSDEDTSTTYTSDEYSYSDSSSHPTSRSPSVPDSSKIPDTEPASSKSRASSGSKKPAPEKDSEREKPKSEKDSERKKPKAEKHSERKKPAAEKDGEGKKPAVEKDGEGKTLTAAKDSKSHEGLGFCFNPDSAMATEFSITIDPEEPDPLEYALNNGILPIICGYMPPSAAPCMPSFPPNNSKESSSYVPSTSSKTSSWYGSGSGHSSYSSNSSSIHPYLAVSTQFSQQSEQNKRNSIHPYQAVSTQLSQQSEQNKRNSIHPYPAVSTQFSQQSGQNKSNSNKT